MRTDGWRRFWAVARTHARNFFTNWRVYDAPITTKLGLTARNRLKATFSTAQCCGHRGQPGC
jgi:hypothetical protein